MSVLGMTSILITWALTIFYTQEDAPASLRVSFIHRFAQQELHLDQEYSGQSGRQITFTRFKYYISNLELKRADGTIWRPETKYFIVDINEEMPAVFDINLPGVPAGEYTQLSYYIGLDRIANHSGNQEGVLNPDFGMFWMWETGYTFFKIEGYYGHGASRDAMVFHVGHDECYRDVSLPLSKLKMTGSQTGMISVDADVDKIFSDTSVLNFMSASPGGSLSVMSGDNAKILADSFSGMFSIRK